MALPHPIFMRPTLWIELIYSVIMIATCLIIYFRTKEVHKLSQYKGIKYFRLTFLFFAMSFLLRLIVNIQRMILGGLGFRGMGAGGLPSLLIMYTGSMALLYLIHSMIWKNFKQSDKVSGTLHLIAVIIALTAFLLGREGMILFGLIQFIFFIFATILIIKKHKKRNKKRKGLSQFHTMYLLFFLSWIINGIAMFILITISKIAGLLIYLFSLSLLVFIATKIIKITK